MQREARDLSEEWRAGLGTTPEKRARSEEMAAKRDLWRPLVEAHPAAGSAQREMAKRMGASQAHVARIEKRGYGAWLTSRRRSVQALGEGLQLEVTVKRISRTDDKGAPAVSP